MDWSKPADEERIKRTIDALKVNNIHAVVAKDRKEALGEVIKLLPEGAEIMTTSSLTLNDIGFADTLKSNEHKWVNLKDAIAEEKDPAKRHRLRVGSTGAEYTLGSVHAVTEKGELMVASASGSQIPGYAFSSQNVILVVGTQKIVKDIDEGMARIREHSVPFEDKRMKAAGFPGTTFAKLLILYKEPLPRKLTVIFVKEELGF